MARKFVTQLLACLLFLVLASGAQALVLTFDDIGTGSAVPDGYGGLSWENMYYLNGNTYSIPGSGYKYGLASGDYVAYNGFADQALVISGSVFDFNGAYLTGVWNDYLNVAVTGYLGGVQTFQRTVVTSAYAPTWFDFDFFGIDTLVFDSFGGIDTGTGGSGTHFAMDNFTFNESAPVPEPSTFLLLGAGIVGLAVLRKKKI